MINFRFHLVSLIAVFLALGLGILVGSTVVDQAIVDRLDREIDDVRDESRALRAENDALREDLARAEEALEAAAPLAVEARLSTVPVAVLAERGVGDDAVNETIALLRTAGAEVPAILWLDQSWALTDEEDLDALREITGNDGDAGEVRADALAALARRLLGPETDVRTDGSAPTTTTAPAAGAPTTVAPGSGATTTSIPAGGAADEEIVAALVDAGFVELDGADLEDLDTFPERAGGVLHVTGTDSELLESALTAEVARVFADSGVPTVAAEVFVERDDEDAPERGDALAGVRDDDLRDEVSTVDDLDLVQGRLAVVFAIEDALDGVLGHYGYGGGADRPLPVREA